jgi:hypothetical protein
MHIYIHEYMLEFDISRISQWGSRLSQYFHQVIPSSQAQGPDFFWQLLSFMVELWAALGGWDSSTLQIDSVSCWGCSWHWGATLSAWGGLTCTLLNENIPGMPVMLPSHCDDQKCTLQHPSPTSIWMGGDVHTRTLENPYCHHEL